MHPFHVNKRLSVQDELKMEQKTVILYSFQDVYSQKCSMFVKLLNESAYSVAEKSGSLYS